MTDKKQIIIDTDKYFLEVVDEGGGTVGYIVVHPEQLLRDIMKQNKQLTSKIQECEKYEQALDEIAAHYQKVIKNITTYDDSYDASISIEALHNISDIINKAKGEGNEE